MLPSAFTLLFSLFFRQDDEIVFTPFIGRDYFWSECD